MNQTTIREVEGQEMLDILHRLGTYAFNSSPPLLDKEPWAENARARQGTSYVALFVAEEAGAAGTGVAIAASAHLPHGRHLGRGDPTRGAPLRLFTPGVNPPAGHPTRARVCV